jgi:hypothetical protein
MTKATQGAYIGDSYITGALSPALQATLDPILMMNGAVTGYTNGAGRTHDGLGVRPDSFRRSSILWARTFD